MAHKFAEILFTPSVRSIQTSEGSRESYARFDQGDDYNHCISEREASFIAARDSFYMASISESGWPYLQHRGGPAGFMKVLDERTIAFADYSGNRQYVSVGNFQAENRVALFFMDYPNRRRLKLLGRVNMITPDTDTTGQLRLLEDTDYSAQVERGFIIQVEAFDWNCPQHITPRYSGDQVTRFLNELRQENHRLKDQQRKTNSVNQASSISGPEEPINGHLGDGPLELVVTGIRQLSLRVRAFEFRDPEGRDLPKIEAGAHLKIPVRLANGELTERHYSIASNPARRDVYEIAVLNNPRGGGGSRAIHQTFQIGTVIKVEPPASHFSLHDDNRPAILIAGGIGITPIKSIAHALAATGRQFELHYTGRNHREMAYFDRLQRQFGTSLSTYSTDSNERLNIDTLLRNASDQEIFYVCGPKRMMSAVHSAARRTGIARNRIRMELFS